MQSFSWNYIEISFLQRCSTFIFKRENMSLFNVSVFFSITLTIWIRQFLQIISNTSIKIFLEVAVSNVTVFPGLSSNGKIRWWERRGKAGLYSPEQGGAFLYNHSSLFALSPDTQCSKLNSQLPQKENILDAYVILVRLSSPLSLSLLPSLSLLSIPVPPPINFLISTINRNLWKGEVVALIQASFSY